MFKKILIANRGEIACRIIKSARKLGIPTVAVYSEADQRSLHVELADEAMLIGPAPSDASYLSIEKILQACQDSGAKAVHPGYGFLSENAEFAEHLQAADITFIGPNANAIRSMGDKITSKRLAAEAGVNTIPGCGDVIKDTQHAVQVAQQVGYPVMLKATAGGGGKGMRIAYNDAECADAFERTSNEARTAFGDDRIFIERYIESPRHIEIQILADRQGNTIHLGERECSLQRRHQKVIEESPSPLLDPATREAMGQQAIALAKAVGYDSAGTVEFIADADRNFYFLEMNTRLQVEHPVTEFVTGFDLVEQMIRSAAGEPLAIQQKDIQQNGWAIEARVYAEDPQRNFLPSVGRLTKYLPPVESATVRIDSGVREGDEVSIYYDPMIAKLVVHGESREQAITRLRDALNSFYIDGVSHNLDFLSALVEHPRFNEGRLTTNLIAEEYPDGFDPTEVAHAQPEQLIAIAAALHRYYQDRAASISGQMVGYERQVQSNWVVVNGEQRQTVEVTSLSNAPLGAEADQPFQYSIQLNEKNHHVLSDWQFGQPLFCGTINGCEICLTVERIGMIYRLRHSGSQFDLRVLTARGAEFQALMPKKSPPDLSQFLLSPMPGLLTQLLIEPGQNVKQGQDLAIVEAMKMENVLHAERDGTIAKTLAVVGDTLAVDQPILEFETSN